MRYNGKRHKTEIGTTKRKKIRTVDFCDTLAVLLRKAKTEQSKNSLKYGPLYSLNYYKEALITTYRTFEAAAQSGRLLFPFLPGLQTVLPESLYQEHIGGTSLHSIH